jgi:hypothetical protein
MRSLFNDIPRPAVFTLIDICSVGHRANPAAARSVELSPGSQQHGEIHHPHKSGLFALRSTGLLLTFRFILVVLSANVFH